ncbi:MAG: sodium:solute symporter family transporter [Rubrobacteraceae bacterium]
MSSWVMVLLVSLVALGFAGAGVIHSRGRSITLEEYITARGSVGALTTAATLVASGMGAWILFGPAEAATWGGLPAILGYAVGSAAPLLAFILLGRRIRRVMPEGHTLTEYVWHRYGRGMYLFTLLVMLFYMFVFLAAEVTGMALIANLIAGVPLWITALIVMAATLAYTTYGGLRASIFTDTVQILLILPLLAAVVVAGYVLLGGIEPTYAGLAERAPELAGWGHLAGFEGALTFVIAILAANLFHQGYWQRVYAVRDERALGRGFLISAVVVIPIVFAMGLFGLAAVGLGRADTPSVALFSVLLEALPPWLALGLAVLGLALVMSSADTLLNGIASIVAVDLRRVKPDAPASFLLLASRISTLVLAVPLLLIASQGYSVLYLLLLADLVCTAAVFPVFFGLYSERFTGRAAVAGALAGLVAGGLLFPDPAMTRGSLLGAFVVAAAVSVFVSVVMTPRRSTFDLGQLAKAVRYLDE